MADLRTQGRLIQQKKERKLIRKTELLTVKGVDRTLSRKPARENQVGTFQAPEADWWKHTNLENADSAKAVEKAFHADLLDTFCTEMSP